ncbi:Lacal_2735 family protein [Cellulophaga baltica 4]|nr:Lacal_2735 family protein [Cellulophaga baltica 4]
MLLNHSTCSDFFKKKSEKDKLYETYQKLLQEAHKLSTTNRKLSDQKTYEAEEIMKKIEQLSTKME